MLVDFHPEWTAPLLEDRDITLLDLTLLKVADLRRRECILTKGHRLPSHLNKLNSITIPTR